MLSRVADSLFWISRYVERAENIARMVDVHQQLMLDLPTERVQKLKRNWLPLAACLGEHLQLKRRSQKGDVRTVTEFLLYDREHSNSILSCLSAARENARTVREQISPEMWEQINRTYLWYRSANSRHMFERNQYEFFQRVIKTLQLFQGITDNTMLHGEGWEFMRAGRFIERADKTSRMLDDKFYLLNKKRSTPSEMLLQYSVVLKCCNAREVYQRKHGAELHPGSVAKLLLLDDSFPRSVRYCVQEIDLALRRISGVPAGCFSNKAEKLCGRLLAELSFSSIEDYQVQGMHQSMDDLQGKLNAIGAAIYHTYIHQEFKLTAIGAAIYNTYVHKGMSAEPAPSQIQEVTQE